MIVLTALRLYSQLYDCTRGSDCTHSSMIVLMALRLYPQLYDCTRGSTIVITALRLYSQLYDCTHSSTIVLTALRLYSQLYDCTRSSTIVLASLRLYSQLYNCTFSSAIVLVALRLYSQLWASFRRELAVEDEDGRLACLALPVGGATDQGVHDAVLRVQVQRSLQKTNAVVSCPQCTAVLKRRGEGGGWGELGRSQAGHGIENVMELGGHWIRRIGH